MTKAYVIGQISVIHPDAYAAYAAQVPQTIAAFGGRYLVRGGSASQLEGTAQGDRNVVIEFPSRDMAEAWYTSDAYQAIIKCRTDNATGELVLVNGYTP